MDHELWVRLGTIDGMLAQILIACNELKIQETQMNIGLDALTVQVEQTKTVQASAITLIEGFGNRLTALADALAQAGIDNTLVLAERDDLAALTTVLANAVTATPVL